MVEAGGKVSVTFDSTPGETFSAVITEVGVVTGMSTTYPVTVRLEEADDDPVPLPPVEKPRVDGVLY